MHVYSFSDRPPAHVSSLPKRICCQARKPNAPFVRCQHRQPGDGDSSLLSGRQRRVLQRLLLRRGYQRLCHRLRRLRRAMLCAVAPPTSTRLQAAESAAYATQSRCVLPASHSFLACRRIRTVLPRHAELNPECSCCRRAQHKKGRSSVSESCHVFARTGSGQSHM